MKKLIVLFLISLSAYSNTFFCNKSLESLPTLEGGRVKPLYVLATESFKFISGKSKLSGHPVVDFCLLSAKSMGLKSELSLNLRVDHIKSKELLGLQENETITAQKALEDEELIRSELMTLKKNDSYKKDLNKVYGRIQTYKKIIQGDAWTLPTVTDGKVKFIPIVNALTQQNVEKFGQGQDAFKKYFEQAKASYIDTEGDKYLIELTYKKLKLFSWSMLLVLIGIAAGVLVKSNKPLYFVTVITILVQIIGMAMRVYISGRAPITNMYETVMFSGFGALVISCGITIFRKDSIFIISGLAYNLLCLMMMTFAGDMLDDSISPLVPVLRDNFWLSTHVTTIILSYAALALSWVLANIILIKQIKGKLENKDYKYYQDLIYTCLKFGVVLLAAGIILGGVWADYSWGRFWGWDPKETWSLIVLLIYMAILHGKYTNWITNQRFVPLVAGAFLSVMMAWFGVNYILASGLHSYGFSEGGAIFLGSFFLAQISILVINMIKNTALNKKQA